MADYLYVVNDMVFENEEGKHNAKSRALRYCKKNNINENIIIALKNDVELAYYRMLCEKKSRGEIINLDTNMFAIIMPSFYNANREFLAPVATTIPFVFKDKEGKKHYQVVVGELKDLNGKLVDEKYMFDKYYAVENKYLELIYYDEDGCFKSWLINDIGVLRKKYRLKQHKEQLARLHRLREQEKYDRLKRLRNEGKITDNQRKELYRLEEKYERS